MFVVRCLLSLIGGDVVIVTLGVVSQVVTPWCNGGVEMCSESQGFGPILVKFLV